MGSRKKQQLLNIKIPQNKNKLQNYTHIANIIDNVYLSDYNTAQDFQVLTLFKITHIINCSPQNCINNFGNKIQYLNVEILDEWEANLIENLDAIFKFIQKSQRQNGRILIHCYRGISRSPSVVIAYIIKNLNINENQALKYCKSRYQQAEPNASFMIQLQSYYKQQQDNQKLFLKQQQQQQQQQFQEIQKLNNVNSHEIKQIDQNQQQQLYIQRNLTNNPLNQQENQFYQSSPFNLLHFQQNKSLFQNVEQSCLISLQNSTISNSNIAQQQNIQDPILNGWNVSKNNQDYQINLNKISSQKNDFRISKNDDQLNNNNCLQINKYPELLIPQEEHLSSLECQNQNNNQQNLSLNKPLKSPSNYNHINYVKGKTQIEQFSDQNLDNIQTHWDHLSYNCQSHMDLNYRHTFSASCQDYSQLVLNSNEGNQSKFFRHSYHGDINSMNSYLIQTQSNSAHSQPLQQNISEETNTTKQDPQNQVEIKKNNILIHSNEELDSNCSIYAQSDKCSKQQKIISENQTQNNQNGFQSDSFASEKSYIENNSINQQRELRNSNQSNMSTTNNNETSFCSINHEKKYYNDYFYDDVDETLFGSWPQKKISNFLFSKYLFSLYLLKHIF
ncbi:dual specificity phosphatase domain protein (macronuclear) [Tetrahymena thermophila SB210]|uniref:Dual specificity phosphatase domain protein n=1 Tax=Tetrahymena thermophila (strain SB210) TaxID=312017 RepID=Q23E47_TETTS|nr:dual specificity phosphatase domain protein [Tetrahymena thermophila SB210]EAR94740.2 dual specificity phosphatase domain protein [Tetrahymena thermophila SB210]|eukprot:XP_001014985.2 dual specificity phosphatase domain protein [Tetrahymena thermophila SB210]